MAVIGDVVELLKHWDRWKRIDETPERLDALEKRVAELESKLQRAPGEACPKCGALEFRTTRVQPLGGRLGQLGASYRHMECKACKHTERRTEKSR
jgi:predicted nucleic-acid-binding Zn-ribbon protein